MEFQYTVHEIRIDLFSFPFPCLIYIPAGLYLTEHHVVHFNSIYFCRMRSLQHHRPIDPLNTRTAGFKPGDKRFPTCSANQLQYVLKRSLRRTIHCAILGSGQHAQKKDKNNSILVSSSALELGFGFVSFWTFIAALSIVNFIVFKVFKNYGILENTKLRNSEILVKFFEIRFYYTWSFTFLYNY